MPLHKRSLFIFVFLTGYSVGVSFADEQQKLPDNYLITETVARIISSNAIYDYEISLDGKEIIFIKKFLGRLDKYPAPFLDAYSYKGSTCSDFSNKNPEAAKRLDTSFNMKNYYCHLVFSNDNKLVALISSRCSKDKKPVEITVINNESLEPILVKKLDEKYCLSDMVWKPNSQVLLILEVKSHFALNPLALLSAISGHPVYYNDLYFSYLNIKSGELFESKEPFIRNIKYGEGYFYVRKY